MMTWQVLPAEKHQLQIIEEIPEALSPEAEQRKTKNVSGRRRTVLFFMR